MKRYPKHESVVRQVNKALNGWTIVYSRYMPNPFAPDIRLFQGRIKTKLAVAQ